MTSIALGKFEHLASLQAAQEATDFVFTNPVLLAKWALPEFTAYVKTCPPDKRAGAERALNFVQSVREKVTADPRIYPLGSGPLEAVTRRTLQGEISQSEACTLVARQDICCNLSAAYVYVLSTDNQRRANDGDVQRPLIAQRILLAALDARRNAGLPGQEELETIVANDYAVIAARSLWDFADGRLFKDAARRAIAAQSFDPRPWNRPGEIEFALGVLHLDPYIYQRTTTNFQHQVTNWRRRPLDQLRGKLGEDEMKEILMPEPLEAITAASGYFYASAKKRDGVDRGLSLKGYIEAEFWKQIADGKAASNLSRVADEAKQLLAEERFAGVRAQIDGMTSTVQGGRAPKAGDGEEWISRANQFLARDTAQLVQQLGLVQATDLLNHMARAVAEASPQLAFALWRKALPAFLERDEDSREGFLSAGLPYFRAALANPDVDRYGSQPPLQAAAECQTRAAAENWTKERLAATLLSIAVQSQQGDRESEGIQVLQAAADADSDFTSEFLPVFVWMSAVLKQGMASNSFHANQYAASVQHYAVAARQYLRAEMPARALSLIGNGADIVQRSPERIAEFVAYAGDVVPELERQGGPPAIRQVGDMCRIFMRLLTETGKANPVVLALLLDIAKGSAFAAAVRTGGGFDWIDSQESQAALTRITEARARPGAVAEQEQRAGALSDDELLTMYAEDEELNEGDNPAAILHNLEIRYDSQLRKALGARPAQRERWLPLPDNMSDALGPETVLVRYYSGVAPNGNAGLYINIFTREETRAAIADLSFPGSRIFLNNVEADVLALGVTKTRKSIIADPEDGILSKDARAALKGDAGYLGGPVGEILREFKKAGKSHLCIQPHGPLHFFPFHLLPFGDTTAAQEWTVTYIPSMELLDPARREMPARGVPVASFGLEFKDGKPHGLRRLPGAEDEARAVASAMGLSALTGNAATESALIDAFAHAQRIHIATHGLHAVSAPSFQRIFLMPDSRSDGVLHAYELLRYDLRGVDLLTLSACETALGRVDIGDNFRGLPANAFIAGAATVIGTLWPVEDAAAKTFFRSLYEQLATGAAKREAFAAAQKATRSAHPQFRDWGAFTYSGRW